jgi:hypothetical protein
MKVKKIEQRVLLFTCLLVITALAAMPAAAQISPAEPTPQAPLTAQTAESSVYLPIIMRPPPPDLFIGEYEVTQATQNLDNTVSLVAGKATVVRVYAQTDVTGGVAGVSVSVSGTRNGVPLPGSPLLVGPKSVGTTWTRNNLNTSFNFSLPSDWLSGAVSLQIRVDPNNLFDEGSKESNNIANFQANFNNVPALAVKVIPITYIDPATNLEFPPASYTYLGPGLVRMYPINAATVTRRAGEYFWYDNLRIDNNWSRLLLDIARLKDLDGAPLSQVYYGLVPLFNELGYTWFSSGIAGIGYVGLRVSAGLADASAYGLSGSDIANHEIGHNLGREHAPCGVVGEDPDYPYVGGLIGQTGLRIDLMQLYDPAVYADIMGYCDPVWISDHNYQALYAAQMATASAAQVSPEPVESLLVSALLAEDGVIEMDPVYAFSGIPDPLPAESEYLLELLDDQGERVAAFLLPVQRAEEEQVKTRAIVSRVPLPGEPFARVRIVENGKPAAERAISQTDPALLAQPAVEAGEQGAVLRWGATNTPAIVRYTQDGGESWTTLALDHLGGELALDEQTLPAGILHFEIILADQVGSTLTLDWEAVP